MITYNEGLQVFESTLLNEHQIIAGFGTRMSGDGRKVSDLISYFNTKNITYDSLVVPNQIHSVNIEYVPSGSEHLAPIETTDGVITDAFGTMLTVVTADCVPVIYFDRKTDIVAISHQGWRGSLKKMSQQIVKAMVKHGASPSTTIAVIGPSIGACCYEIYGDRQFEFLSEFEEIKDRLVQTRLGKTTINLPYLNYWQLLQSGIKKEHIDFFPFCTRCDVARFFSYQRDDKNKYGEMFSFIMKKFHG